MNKPKISIIVPVYNAERYIRRMLDSILYQSFSDYELLLIDDGSTDSSGTILDEYSQIDSRIQVFHQLNSGPSVARNFGIEHAKGEFLSFVDSDDELDPEFYEAFFVDGDNYDALYQGYIREIPSKNQVMVICPEQMVEKNGDCRDIIYFLRKKELLGWAWIKLFRRSIVMEHNIRFNTSFRWREDSLFAMQYCRYIHSINVIPKCHYHYYVYCDSLSRSMRDVQGIYLLGKEMFRASKYLMGHSKAKVFEERYFWSVLRRAFFSCYKFDASKELRYLIINDVKKFTRNKSMQELDFKHNFAGFYYSLLFRGSVCFIDQIMLLEHKLGIDSIR